MKNENIKSGIYCIKNHINDKCYIGSTKNISERKLQHLYLLKMGKHHATKLQSFVNKYGIDCIYFEVIELVESINELKNREQFYLDKISPFFNSTLQSNYNPLRDGKIKMKIQLQERENRKIQKLVDERAHYFTPILDLIDNVLF